MAKFDKIDALENTTTLLSANKTPVFTNWTQMLANYVQICINLFLGWRDLLLTCPEEDYSVFFLGMNKALLLEMSDIF